MSRNDVFKIQPLPPFIAVAKREGGPILLWRGALPSPLILIPLLGHVCLKEIQVLLSCYFLPVLIPNPLPSKAKRPLTAARSFEGTMEERL